MLQPKKNNAWQAGETARQRETMKTMRLDAIAIFNCHILRDLYQCILTEETNQCLSEECDPKRERGIFGGEAGATKVDKSRESIDLLTRC